MTSSAIPDMLTDLAMVPSYSLNQCGNMKPLAETESDAKSKFSESELNDLIPIGRRYGVRCMCTRTHVASDACTHAPPHALSHSSEKAN